MDEIIEQAKALREDIDELPAIKEYYRLKELYENDLGLKTMRMNMARLKSEGKEEERNNLYTLYKSHPLVNNFEVAEMEAKRILKEIKDTIE